MTDEIAEAMKDAETAIEVARETLTGDLRDFILGRIKGQQKPWEKMRQHEQEALIYETESAITHAVAKALVILASNGNPHLVGKLAQVTVKDGLKAVVLLSHRDQLRHDLIDRQGSNVLVVLPPLVAEFKGERSKAEAAPDQGELDLEDQDDD